MFWGGRELLKLLLDSCVGELLGEAWDFLAMDGAGHVVLRTLKRHRPLPHLRVWHLQSKSIGLKSSGRRRRGLPASLKLLHPTPQPKDLVWLP